MMCLDNVRYFKVGKAMIFEFNTTYKLLKKFGFKPYHKRKRFKDPRLLYCRRFYLIYEIDIVDIVEDPEKYLEITEIEEWRELILGVSYL